MRRVAPSLQTYIDHGPTATAWSEDWQWHAANFSVQAGFNSTVAVVILVNMLILGVATTTAIPEWVEIFFVVFFVAEMTLKLYGQHSYFFRDPWNNLDLAVVGVSVAEQIVTLAANWAPSNAHALRMLRVLRLLRVLRVARLIPFSTRPYDPHATALLGTQHD
jgi:hypothetical protein